MDIFTCVFLFIVFLMFNPKRTKIENEEDNLIFNDVCVICQETLLYVINEPPFKGYHQNCKIKIHKKCEKEFFMNSFKGISYKCMTCFKVLKGSQLALNGRTPQYVREFRKKCIRHVYYSSASMSNLFTLNTRINEMASSIRKSFSRSSPTTENNTSFYPMILTNIFVYLDEEFTQQQSRVFSFNYFFNYLDESKTLKKIYIEQKENLTHFFGCLWVNFVYNEMVGEKFPTHTPIMIKELNKYHLDRTTYFILKNRFNLTWRTFNEFIENKIFGGLLSKLHKFNQPVFYKHCEDYRNEVSMVSDLLLNFLGGMEDFQDFLHNQILNYRINQRNIQGQTPNLTELLPGNCGNPFEDSTETEENYLEEMRRLSILLGYLTKIINRDTILPYLGYFTRFLKRSSNLPEEDYTIDYAFGSDYLPLQDIDRYDNYDTDDE